MYRGRLSDGSLVLIRCLKLKRSHTSQSFNRYIELILKLRHSHLVSARGHWHCNYDLDLACLGLDLRYELFGEVGSRYCIRLRWIDTFFILDLPSRDYVFNCRSKDIAASWPFSQKFLKLCLKHGVRDIFPPFEPPDRVRDQCLHKAEEAEQPASWSGAEEISGRFDSTDDADNIKSKTSLLSDELVVVF